MSEQQDAIKTQRMTPWNISDPPTSKTGAEKARLIMTLRIFLALLSTISDVTIDLVSGNSLVQHSALCVFYFFYLPPT